MEKRGSGLLLHISSLPSPFGIGDFGHSAYSFVDFMAASKQSYWQILPLSPSDPAYDNSPYHSISAFAFNKLFISPELLVENRFLSKADLDPVPYFPKGLVNYEAVIAYKSKLLHKAYEQFKKKKNREEFEEFCAENTEWLDDFALFVSLKSHFQAKSWNKWPAEIRDRQHKALQDIKRELHDKIEMEKFLQHVFFRQWTLLKRYCHKKGIRIIGDMPLYLDYDSVDLWTHPEIFKLDSKKRPTGVAGVPPDYFSKTGQLWGNPVFRWDVLKERKYDWWMQRFEQNLKLFDIARIDHFRGLVGYWEVPAGSKTAVNGKWIKAPAMDFFSQLKKRFRPLPVIVEDLGFITPDVREVMNHFALPGMKVLLFAFGKNQPMHPYLPHTYERNCVVYTGTHDNNTARGWFERELKPEGKKRMFRYLGQKVEKDKIHWELIRLAMMSVANTVIIPMQDVLGLGVEARMNRPAMGRGNWKWRLLPEQLTSSLAKKLLVITEAYGRALTA